MSTDPTRLPGSHHPLVNFLAGLGAVLYILLQCAGPCLNLPPVDLTLKNLAFSLLVLIQVMRGLAWHLGFTRLPQWLLLSKMDRRFGADCTVVFLVLMLVLELTCRSHLDPNITAIDPHIVYPLVAVQVVLGIWLLVLSFKASFGKSPVGLAAVGIFSLIFLSPIFLAGGLAFGLAKYFDLRAQRELETLTVAAIMPLMISVGLLAYRDKRDRGKNTLGVIITQFAALPAIPLFYLILKNFWPANISVMLCPVAGLVLLTIPRLLERRIRPWLVKERAEALLAQLSREQALAASPGPEIEADLAGIVADLVPARLRLKVAEDHVDRADALWKLGEAQVLLGRYEAAENAYHEAVHAYNKAIELEPGNHRAQTNKFKTVEALSVAQRLKLGPQ